MCYPADHYDGVFIPNWALWFVVQLEEYLERSGDRATVEALKERVLDLFEYFEPFRNEKGLLEKLASWVFVEWSKANQFVQDVNFPSNIVSRIISRSNPLIAANIVNIALPYTFPKSIPSLMERNSISFFFNSS